jgi:hypothetical protein
MFLNAAVLMHRLSSTHMAEVELHHPAAAAWLRATWPLSVEHAGHLCVQPWAALEGAWCSDTGYLQWQAFTCKQVQHNRRLCRVQLEGTRHAAATMHIGEYSVTTTMCTAVIPSTPPPPSCCANVRHKQNCHHCQLLHDPARHQHAS